jgi:lysozyme
MKTKIFLLATISLIIFSACNSNTKKETPSKTETKDTIVTSTPIQPVAKEQPYVYGIDISSYQGNESSDINIHKDSLGFIFCKATQGTYYVDPDFQKNWSQIKKDGFIRGAYHFYMDTDDPVIQAKHFAKTLSTLDSTDLSPVVDVEAGGVHHSVTAEEFAKDLLLFISTLEKELGRKPIIYTNIPFADEYLKDERFSSYALWVANYVDKKQPDLPLTWKKEGWTFWQRNSSFKLENFTDDSDVFNGDTTQLLEFIKTYR